MVTRRYTGLLPGWRLPESHLLHQSDRSLSSAALQAFQIECLGAKLFLSGLYQKVEIASIIHIGKSCHLLSAGRGKLYTGFHLNIAVLLPPRHQTYVIAGIPGFPDRRGGDSQDVLSGWCSCHRAGAGKYSAHLKAQRSSSLAYLTFYHILRPQHSSHSDTLLFSKEFQQCPHSLQFHYFQHCLQFLNQSLLFHNPSPLPLEKDTPYPVGSSVSPLSKSSTAGQS